MGRFATPALLACALACALATAVAAPAAQTSRTVLQFGDSLAVGTGIFLPSALRGWTVNTSVGVSRHADEGPAGLRSYGALLPHVLVISLGTNDDPGAASRFAGTVRDVVRIAGPYRCVIWSTIVRPPFAGVSYDGYNRALRRVARGHANLLVFDWQALARSNPQWFGPDGVHPNADGYRKRAAELARLVRSCA
jgi:lysophospholipase L1-like esterase